MREAGSTRRRLLPRPMMAVAVLAMLAGLWAGLARMGWSLPALAAGLPARHGGLMVGGFIGTLIAVERAVGLGGGRTWIAPVLSALSAAALMAGAPLPWAQAGFTAAGAALVGVYAAVVRLQPALHTVVMAAGALLWLAGNLLWWAGQPVPHVVPWWAGFLILTVVGERLELSRLLAPSRGQVAALAGTVVLFCTGLTVGLLDADLGVRLAGVGLAGMGIWLLRNDIARRTLRSGGVHSFTAAALLAGHAWLAAAGVLWVCLGAQRAGIYYDAMLHAVFLGFVMSMIFGHAPIILPAVLGRSMAFSPVFYGHLLLLHASLALRVAGDLLALPAAARWGGLLNVVAVVWFAANSLAGLARAQRPGR